jgi:hypothetical protein
MSSAETARVLTDAGYWGLVSGDAADRAWEASHDGAGLRELILSAEADPAARFLAAEVLARRGALPGGLPADALARAYVDGLRAGASADMANPWGIPSGPLGPAGERVASLGAAAVAPLEGALDDEGGLRFVGSREASIGNSYGWRVKDAAASVLATITGQAFDVDRDPAKRDAAIEDLRRRVDGGGSGDTP